MTYRIQIAESALKMLEKISDRRVREKIGEAVETLKTDPEKRGKPLWRDLSGYRSVRAAGQRFRIIYRVDNVVVTVIVVAAGIRKEGDRKDIYALARKLVKLGLA